MTRPAADAARIHWAMIAGGAVACAAGSFATVRLSAGPPQLGDLTHGLPPAALYWPAEIAVAALVAVLGCSVVAAGIARSIPKLHVLAGLAICVVGLALIGHGTSRVFSGFDARVTSALAGADSPATTIVGAPMHFDEMEEICSGVLVVLIGGVFVCVSLGRALRARTFSG